MYEQKTIEEIVRQMDTDERTGLSGEEAKRRLEHYGPNCLKEEKKREIWRGKLKKMENLEESTVGHGIW